MPPLLAVADTATRKAPGDMTAPTSGISTSKASKRGLLSPNFSSKSRSDRRLPPQAGQQPTATSPPFPHGNADGTSLALASRSEFSKSSPAFTRSPVSPVLETTFSLRDTLVHNFELALRRQGSLSSSGGMSLPGPSNLHLPQRVGHTQQSDLESEITPPEFAQWLPASPPYYASSVSPSTPSIPPTPLTDYPGSPVFYSTYSRPAISRSRSGSLASMQTYISTSPTLHFNPVVLPIGQKVPKWREATHWEETDDDRQMDWSSGFDGSPSGNVHSTTRTARPWRRTTRVPSGPRPMQRLSNYPNMLTELGFSTPTASPARSEVGSGPTASEWRSTYRENPSSENLRDRRRGIIGSPPQPSGFSAGSSTACASPDTRLSEELQRNADDLIESVGRATASVLDEYLDDMEDDFTIASSDSSCSLPDSRSRYSMSVDHISSIGPAHTLSTPPLILQPTAHRTSPRPILPLRIPSRHPAYPVSPSSPIALPALTVMIPSRNTALSPAISLSSNDDRRVPTEAERSAFESDSDRDDDDDDDDDTSIFKHKTNLARISGGIGRLRRAFGSNSNLRGRLSLAHRKSPSTSSLHARTGSSSSDSVTSLRARQLGEASRASAGNFGQTHISRMGRQMCLSPIPATPLETAPPQLGHHESLQLESPCSLPTPITPDVERTTSFLWSLANAAPLVPPPPPPRLPQRPPSLPLPPTPGSIADIALARPVPRRQPRANVGEGLHTEIDQWRSRVPVDNRLTVVDPNASMVKLEMSIAKLEAYAPQSAGRSDSSRTPSPGRSISEDSGAGSSQFEPSVSVLPLDTPPPLPAKETTAARDRRASAKPPVPPKSPFVMRRIHADASAGESLFRKPSLGLLPEFEFEPLDQRIFDLPVRSDSLVDLHDQEGHRPHKPPDGDGRSQSRNHPSAVLADTRRGRRTSRPLSRDWSHNNKPLPCPCPEAHAQPALFASPEAPGVSSFMDFSPQSPQGEEKGQRQRSRVRRLLSRMPRRDFMRGLRESFNFPHHAP